MAIEKRKFDITAAGYAVVREAFNQTLKLCAEKLTKAEFGLAAEILGLAMLEDDIPFHEILADTALYSRKQTAGARKKKRAIDRIAPIVERVHDHLRSAIAARLPLAIYSIFKLEAGTEPGSVLGRDLLDNDRAISIMDSGLATSVERNGEIMIAGRFVDLGAWHIGIGIIEPVLKSEALAISLAANGVEGGEYMRGPLHELIYATQLHDQNLVMAALEPMIMGLAEAIDADLVDVDDITEGLGSLLSGNLLDADEDENTDI